MNKIVIFADNNVGLECIKFLLSTYMEDIVNIVVVDKNSTIYKYLEKISFDEKKIIMNEDINIKLIALVDYIFLLWWPNIIKKNIIYLAKKGVINTHPSLLPYNRGKNYNFWNLVEDVPFGVTLHFVNEEIDSGDMIFQKKIDKSWEDNGKSLYEKAQVEMILLFKESYIKIINSDFITKKQDLKQGSYHNASELEKASEIFLSQKYLAKDLLNLLRARTFSPYNSCYFYDDKEKYEVIINIKKVENESN